MQPDAPVQNEATTAECLARISRLPHAGIIRPEDALRWTRLTLGIDPERIFWHIARAGGVGGSEAGALLVWACGEGCARESAERLALRKLLVLPPDRGNDDTKRGIFLEPFIRRIYEDKLTRDGHAWRRRDDLQAQVEAGPHPQMPWLRASLDGLYEIDGATVIADFKAPSEASLSEFIRHQNYDDYRAQLNHYALVAEGRGVRVDGLDLAFFDYRRAATEGVRICPIAIDRALQRRLADAADLFWNRHVVRGLVPREARERELSHPDVPASVSEAARRAVHAKILGDLFKNEFEDAREAVTVWVRSAGRIGGGVLPLGSLAEGARGFLEVKARETMDTDAAVGRLRDLGMPEKAIEALRGQASYDTKKLPAAFEGMRRLMERAAAAIAAGGAGPDLGKEIELMLARAPIREAGGFDPAAVAEALASVGEVPHNYLCEDVSANLPRGKAQDLAEFKEKISGCGGELLNSLVSCKQEAEELHEELPDGPVPGV